MARAVDTLEDELGAPMPEGLEVLSAAEMQTLAGLLAAAKARQAQELEQGLEESLNFVPRLMRGPVRKILFG
jgi:hypothetical protein